MDMKETVTELQMINSDIQRAIANLDNLPENARRGLTLETLRKFCCGFISDWTSPKSRLGNYYETPTPRLIIPTQNHYLARLIVPVENFPEKQREHIKPKPHAGKKETFNLLVVLDTVTRKPDSYIVVTEGEIDAMSVAQVTGLPVMATCGADGWHMVLNDLKSPDTYGFGDAKIRLLIMFDPDKTGREQGEKFRQACIDAGIPAVTHFLSTDVCKLDFNQILQSDNGADKIKNIFDELAACLPAEFDAAEKEIAERKQAIADSNNVSDFASAHNLEPVPAGSTVAKSKPVYDTGEGDPPQYTQDFISALLDAIDPTTLSQDGWLSVISSAKNLNVPYDVVDNWSRRDTSTGEDGKPRYNERENYSRWQSVSDPSYGIENLIGKAEKAGFKVKDFKREWYQQHPEYSRPLPNRRRENPSAPRARETPAASAEAATDVRFDVPQDFLETIKYKPRTNLDDAESIIDVFGDRIRFNENSAQFGFYHAGTWTFSDNGNSAVYPYARAIADFIKCNMPAEPKPCASDAPAEEKEKFDKQRSEYLTVKALAKRWSSRNNVAAAVDMLKCFHEIFITTNDLDNHPELLNVKNGVIDLSTGKLYPHSPQLLLTKKSDVAYDPRARSPLFENTLAQIIPDESTRAAVLRFLGYCLTGFVIEHKVLFVYGRGGNGFWAGWRQRSGRKLSPCVRSRATVKIQHRK